MSNLRIFEYEGSPIQFEVVDGKVMANATLMAKAFNKEPNDIFKTKGWKEYEESLLQEDSNLRSEDLRSVKNGDNGQSWIHEELVIEFARRLKPKFAVWCNKKIAELLRTGIVEIEKPLTEAQILFRQSKLLMEHDDEIRELKQEVRELKAHQVTHPQNYYAISGYASLIKLNIDTNTAKTAGKKAASICKELGYVMGSVPDAKYGSVKTYPSDVIETVFKDMRLISERKSA